MGEQEIKGSEGTGKRLKELEKAMEMKERKERRKNLMMRELKVKEGRRKKAVKEILTEIEVKVEVKEVWRIAEDRKVRRKVIEMKVEEERKRREIWEKKRKLRGRKERILEDWMWKERRMS